MIACILMTLVGGIVYLALGAPPRIVELARIAFFVGFFWLAELLASGHALHF
jgi:hypothetical protein